MYAIVLYSIARLIEKAYGCTKKKGLLHGKILSTSRRCVRSYVSRRHAINGVTFHSGYQSARLN